LVKLWANIVNLIGHVEGIDQSGDQSIVVSHRSREGTLAVMVASDCELMLPPGERQTARNEFTRHFYPGRGVQIIGVKTPDRSVRATRIWLF
jgi:hypothetical protein